MSESIAICQPTNLGNKESFLDFLRGSRVLPLPITAIVVFKGIFARDSEIITITIALCLGSACISMSTGHLQLSEKCTSNGNGLGPFEFLFYENFKDIFKYLSLIFKSYPAQWRQYCKFEFARTGRCGRAF
jgi:hypothetical protein